MANDTGTTEHTDRAPDDLAADLKSIGAAWSALNREQPPELLDQAVLNAARRAAGTQGRSQPQAWFRRRPWLGGLAAAAVIVLAVALVIEQGPETPAPPPPRSDDYQLPRPTGDATAKGPARHMAAPLESRAAEQAVPDPAAWIERLRRLKADGETAVFRSELAAFRAAYPDYALPPELLE